MTKTFKSAPELSVETISEWDYASTAPVPGELIEEVRNGTKRFVIVEAGGYSLNIQTVAGDPRTRREVVLQLASALIVAAEGLDG